MPDHIKLISAGSVPLISARRQIASPDHRTRIGLDVVGITKFLSSGKRMVRGFASTDSIDRQGDIVVPGGGSWTLPLPLLWDHRHDTPVGWVRSVELRGRGLWIEAEFADGVGQADRIWAMVDKGLVSAYSIGFRPLKTEPLAGGGLRHVMWELLEVSAVVVPANQDAKIERRATGPIRLIRAALPQAPIRLITQR